MQLSRRSVFASILMAPFTKLFARTTAAPPRPSHGLRQYDIDLAASLGVRECHVETVSPIDWNWSDPPNCECLIVGYRRETMKPDDGGRAIAWRVPHARNHVGHTRVAMNALREAMADILTYRPEAIPSRSVLETIQVIDIPKEIARKALYL